MSFINFGSCGICNDGVLQYFPIFISDSDRLFRQLKPVTNLREADTILNNYISNTTVSKEDRIETIAKVFGLYTNDKNIDLRDVANHFKGGVFNKFYYIIKNVEFKIAVLIKQKYYDLSGTNPDGSITVDTSSASVPRQK